MNVWISKHLPAPCISRLKQAGLQVITTEKQQVWSKQEIIEKCQGVDFLLFIGKQHLDAAFFEACGHLKGIALASVGYNHVDMEAATRAGIPVSNTPEVLNEATADIALLLMLAVSRKAFFRARQITAGEWKDFEFTDHLGLELYGKTLGIFGLGRIGQAFARKAQAAFNMQIIYHNRQAKPEAEEALGAKYVSFEDLLKQSDVLSVHCNLSAETANRFNAVAFKQMKPTSIFINTARGGVHHEADLIQALQEEEIWGAGLDVSSPEPMSPDNPLLYMSNVCVLPHIGSATEETRNKMAFMAVDNLIAQAQGKPMPQVLNPEVYT